MTKMIRRLWRKLTLKHRLKVGGPLHITFPKDGIYLVTWGGNSEICEFHAGDTVTYMNFESTTYLRELDK